MPKSKNWIDLPGLQQLLKEEIPLAAQVLSEGRYPVIVRGTPRIGKSHIRNTIIQESKLPKLEKGIINCAAIPNNLAESILFGHKKGAFTGAKTDKNGLLYNKSDPSKVICLEEIGELPKHVQAKLLVFFDTGLIMPVGASWGEVEQSTLRVIATSNATDQDFREDFLARFWEVQVPPLHMRREDILYLLNHFLDGKINHLTNEELYFLMCHNWPGGVTELEKVCLRIKSKFSNAKVLERHDNVVKLTSNLGYWKAGYPYIDFCHNLKNHKDFSLATLFPNLCAEYPNVFTDEYPPKKLRKASLESLREEWDAWCYFFSQDTKSPNNINEEFQEKVKFSGEKYIFMSPLKFNDTHWIIGRPETIHFINYLKRNKMWNHSGINKLDSFYRYTITELLIWSRNDHDKIKETDQSIDLEPALESISPNDYKKRFWQHQVLNCRTGSEVNKQYGIHRKTAESYLRRFRKDMDQN